MYIDRIPTRPSRMSSAVSVTPLGARFSCSMNARTALTTAARNPCSCVPPCVVGMPLTYERIVSSCDSVHWRAASRRKPFSPARSK
jgi:hypothetical protein